MALICPGVRSGCSAELAKGVFHPFTPGLLFLEKKKQKASDTLPLGKTSGLPVFGKRGARSRLG